MAKIEIYYADYCPFCRRAKGLLDSKDVDYTLYDVEKDKSKRDEMTQRSPSARTIPQIFIDDKAIGGCDDLHALDANGTLDGMIKSAKTTSSPKPQ